MLASECGGTEDVQLFCSEPLTCASRLCKADAAIAQRGEINIILEIEESNIAPAQLVGKALLPAVCCLCKGRSGVFPVSADLLVVQVIDTGGLSGNSTKLDQCRKLLQIIPSSLATTKPRLNYAIHYGTVEMFKARSEQLALLDDIRVHLAPREPVATTPHPSEVWAN
jgi:hypothetical protein